MKRLVTAFAVLAFSTPAFAAPVAQKPMPQLVCKWPDRVPINLTIPELQVQLFWLQGKDFSHQAWTALSADVAAQANALEAKYCKKS
jgi:hypothetical protein